MHVGKTLGYQCSGRWYVYLPPHLITVIGLSSFCSLANRRQAYHNMAAGISVNMAVWQLAVLSARQ